VKCVRDIAFRESSPAASSYPTIRQPLATTTGVPIFREPAQNLAEQ